MRFRYGTLFLIIFFCIALTAAESPPPMLRRPKSSGDLRQKKERTKITQGADKNPDVVLHRRRESVSDADPVGHVTVPVKHRRTISLANSVRQTELLKQQTLERELLLAEAGYLVGGLQNNPTQEPQRLKQKLELAKATPEEIEKRLIDAQTGSKNLMKNLHNTARNNLR